MADFSPAIDFVLKHEDAELAGTVTTDKGGRTRFGIAEKWHKDLPADFYTGPAPDALFVAQRIYRVEYWISLRLGEIVDQEVANKILDMAVDSKIGRNEAVRLVQRAANGLLLGSRRAPAIDGYIGNQTVEAINACAPTDLLEALRNLSKHFYGAIVAKDPSQEPNLKGWLRRAMA